MAGSYKMTFLAAAAALLLNAPQSPPKAGGGAPPTGNVGNVPRGNTGNIPGGNVGAPPRGNAGVVPGGNVGNAPTGNAAVIPGGNVGASPRGNIGNVPGGNVGVVPRGNVGTGPRGMTGSIPGGNVGTFPKGNVQVYSRGNVEDYPYGNVDVIPGIGMTLEQYIRIKMNRGRPIKVSTDRYWGYDKNGNPVGRLKDMKEFDPKLGDMAGKEVVQAAKAPKEEPEPEPFVVTKAAESVIGDLETVRSVLNSVDFAYQGRRAAAEVQVARAISQLRTGRADLKELGAVGFGRNVEPRTSADGKMLFARAKLTDVFARLRSNAEFKDDATMSAVKRSLDSIDAALALPWRNSPQ
jgi:hypothetical protein